MRQVTSGSSSALASSVKKDMSLLADPQPCGCTDETCTCRNDEYRRAVIGFLAGRGVRKADREDMASETLTRVMKARIGGAVIQNPRSYVLAAAHAVLADKARRAQRQPEFLVDLQDEPWQDGSTAPVAQPDLAETVRVFHPAALRRALSRYDREHDLSHDQAEALRLTFAFIRVMDGEPLPALPESYVMPRTETDVDYLVWWLFLHFGGDREGIPDPQDQKWMVNRAARRRTYYKWWTQAITEILKDILEES
jgi:hypothetical protein